MKSLFSACFLLVVQFVFAQQVSVSSISCEHKINPLGVDVPNPMLSWKITSSERNVMQSAYSIRVATDEKFNGKTIVWESGKVTSAQSILQKYQGGKLQSGTRYFWQVKIWDAKNNASAWSKPAFWETGLLQQTDWKALWIEPVQDTVKYMPALLLRKAFASGKKVASAKVYVTSHGLYQLFLNGKKVGNDLLTPGWTSFEKRLQYQVYDVTEQLQLGENAIAAMLGDGWYRGPLAWENKWALYGKTLGLLCQLQIKYADGTSQLIITDDTWKGTQHGPIVKDGIYDGEVYDAQKEIPNWNNINCNDANWQHVNVAKYDYSNIVATETQPVQAIQELHPIKIFKTPKGLLVADLGQNMVGWVKLKMKGKAGTTITLRHAEVLDKAGNFYTDNLRAAKVTVQYTFKSNEEETYEPHFTFMGFRYVSVEGFEGELKPENITGVVVHSNLQPTGNFECSNLMINQLQHNIQWGQKGNFIDVPTDCPQRDERLGWTGDAQAFCRTAAFELDVAPFFTKWLKDVSADQFADGGVPFVVPDVLRNWKGVSAGWADVSTIVPWTMYQVYGDTEILKNQYQSMKAYVEYIRKKAGDSYLWKNGSVFGDWLFYKSNAQTENDGYTDPDMIATMFYAYSTQLLAQTAKVLGHADDAKNYTDLFAQIKATFIKNYVTGVGRIASESQTSYVLALQFNLLPDDLKSKAAQYLVDDIQSRGNHLSTGFLGTPYLCHVLSENGHTDVAYKLLLQQTYPSWLYPVKMGATTIWERWDGQKTDSSFQDVGMNSFNHYAYGAIGDWMYRTVAGIEIGEPGYKKILIQPKPDSVFSYAHASFESSYGTIYSGWKLTDGKMQLTVKIPVNTAAQITLPNAVLNKITESGKSIETLFPTAKQVDKNVILNTGSGDYLFEYNIR